MKKFLKWFSISIGSLLILIIVTLAILPFVINLNSYKGKIEAAVNQQIQGQFTLGSIRLSSWPYLGVSLKNISVKNRPEDFNGSEVVKLNEAALKIHLKSLFKGRLIASFILKEPIINIIASKPLTNAVALIPPPKEVKEEKSTVSLEEITGNKWLQRVLVEKIAFEKGSLQYKDMAVSDAETLLLSPLTIELTHIQIKNPSEPMRFLFETVYKTVPIRLTAGLWANPKEATAHLGDGDLSVGKGKITFDAKMENLNSPQAATHVLLDSEHFDIASLAPLLTLPPETSLSMQPSLHVKATVSEGQIRAQVDLAIGRAEMESKGTPINFNNFELKVEANGSLADPAVSGSLKIAKLSLKQTDVNEIGASFAYANKTASLSDAHFRIFDGTVMMRGSLGLASPSPYDLSLDVSSLNLEKATPIISGSAFFKGSVNGTGLDLASMQTNMNGAGELKMVDGKIHTVNLAGSVLSKEIVSLMEKGLAGRGQIVALPGTQETGTPYKQIYLPFRIQNGRLMIDNMSLENPGYAGDMDGSIGLDKTLDLRGKFSLGVSETESLIPESKVRGFVTKNARLVIPFKITGTVDDPKVRPDEGYVKDLFANAAKKLIQSIAEEAAKKIIPSLPGLPTATPATPTPPTPTEDATKPATDAIKKLF